MGWWSPVASKHSSPDQQEQRTEQRREAPAPQVVQPANGHIFVLSDLADTQLVFPSARSTNCCAPPGSTDTASGSAAPIGRGGTDYSHSLVFTITSLGGRFGHRGFELGIRTMSDVWVLW